VKREKRQETKDEGQEIRQKGLGLTVLVVVFAGSFLSAQPRSPNPQVVAASRTSELTQQPPAGTKPQQLEGFVRADELPQREELPAAPLVMAAYAVAWAAIFLYVWSIWHRLARVEREMADVSRRLQTSTRR
jgi:CcmD family protein